jgi:hypothetical protein
MRAILALFATILMSQPATAQDVDGRGLDQVATQNLTDTFRTTRHGAIMPSGILYTAYYGYARMADASLPACRMQVLTIQDNRLTGEERAPTLSLVTLFRFVTPNSGAPVSISANEMATRCERESVDSVWFSSQNVIYADVLFAAWSAKGAVDAIAEGRHSYDGVDIQRARDAPLKPTTIEFARNSPDTLTSVDINYDIPGQIATADARFDTGRGGGGCALNVHVTFSHAYGARGAENRLTSISVDAVSCYVN